MDGKGILAENPGEVQFTIHSAWSCMLIPDVGGAGATIMIFSDWCNQWLLLRMSPHYFSTSARLVGGSSCWSLQWNYLRLKPDSTVPPEMRARWQHDSYQAVGWILLCSARLAGPPSTYFQKSLHLSLCGGQGPEPLWYCLCRGGVAGTMLPGGYFHLARNYPRIFSRWQVPSRPHQRHIHQLLWYQDIPAYSGAR